MGKTIMGAVVFLDGFIADDNDDVGPLFDLTNGWNGKPAAGEHVFVVTRRQTGSTPTPHRSPSSTASRRPSPPPSSWPATGTSTWPPVRLAARRSSSG
jgi:hypothetical protein